MLVFKERGKPDYPEKNLSEQGREPKTNSTHIWRRREDSNPGHIGGRRAPSPLRHPLLPRFMLHLYAFSINRFLILNELRSSKPFHKRTFWALHNYALLNIRTIVQNYTPTPALIRVVTKISSCRVNTTSRRGIKQLGISLGSIFLLFSSESYRLLMTVLTNTL